mmetsp:Transcript_57770/g.141099  ORF Transcript_57770/g.141099 Transcript_57770/m.141099 type:complete len:203 (+) Transcript_57770:1096-1704(+)
MYQSTHEITSSCFWVESRFSENRNLASWLCHPCILPHLYFHRYFYRRCFCHGTFEKMTVEVLVDHLLVVLLAGTQNHILPMSLGYRKFVLLDCDCHCCYHQMNRSGGGFGQCLEFVELFLYVPDLSNNHEVIPHHGLSSRLLMSAFCSSIVCCFHDGYDGCDGCSYSWRHHFLCFRHVRVRNGRTRTLSPLKLFVPIGVTVS